MAVIQIGGNLFGLLCSKVNKQAFIYPTVYRYIMKQTKVINGNRIFLSAMNKAGIEVPKTRDEFLSLLDQVKKDLRK